MARHYLVFLAEIFVILVLLVCFSRYQLTILYTAQYISQGLGQLCSKINLGGLSYVGAQKGCWGGGAVFNFGLPQPAVRIIYSLYLYPALR